MTVVGELAAGVASSLIFESLKRPFDALASEIKRRDHIGRALTDRPSARFVRDEALYANVTADLARVIGNGQGSLTRSVSQLLSELRRTSILESIAQSALCGSSAESLRAPFASFCERFEGLPFTSDQLFDAVHQSCLLRVEHVNDPALLDIIRSQHSQLSSQIEFISQSLLSGLVESADYSVSVLKDARMRLARSIDAQNRYVSVETLQGAKKFKLKSLAIPGRLAALDERDIASAKASLQTPGLSYLAFRRQFDRAVIVGDPGGGKSTLTQMIAADQAALIVLESAHSGRKEFEPRDLRIPLRVILRRYEARASRAPSYSLFDHLRDEIRGVLDGDDGLARAYLSSALGTGEALIIFDGLDEVLDVGARRRMVEQIEQFAQQFPSCPVLVTSRLVGYRDAPLNEEFAVYGLARFNAEEIAKYSEKAIAAVGQIKAVAAKPRAAEFMAQSARIGGDLRENPLMLGLMVQIFVYRGDVPGNRPEVYKECATLMFEKWDGRREIVADVPRHDVELLDVFGYVASRTFGDAASEEGVSREWLVRELRSHFEGWYVDRASANRAANSLVDFLTGRAWVMSEVGQGVFKFTHRTFLEFFFARNLISESRGIDELLSIDLIPHVIENQWAVIAHLALHMAVFRDGGKSRQAAETIERMLGELGLPAHQEMAFLRFVSSALPYLVIPEGAYLRIVEKVIARAIRLGSQEDASALSIIESVSLLAQNREHLANSEIVRQLSQHLGGAESAELLFAMYALAPWSSRAGREGGVYLSGKTQFALKKSLEDTRASKQRHLRALARSSVAIAKAYVLVYGEERESLLRAHGAEFLQASASPLVPSTIDTIIFQALDVVSARRSRRISGEESRDCSSFINEVAQGVVTGTLNLARLLSPALAKGDGMEREVEIAFRDLWHHCQGSRTSKMLDSSGSNSLICILSASGADDVTLRLRSKRANRYPHSLPAPPKIVKGMVSRVSDPDQRAWLEKWLANQARHLEPEEQAELLSEGS